MTGSHALGKQDLLFRRVRRALGRHGRRLRPDGGSWYVFPEGDKRRRPLVCLDQAALAQLVAAGVVIADDAGGYRLTDACAGAPRSHGLRPPVAISSERRAGFAGLALRARNGLGPLTAAQVRAGLRYQVDIELGSAAAAVTMNWEFIPSDTRCRAGSVPGGAAARERLRVLMRAVPARDLELIDFVCVQERPLAELERRFALPARSGGAWLSGALERLRAAYDLQVAPRETADITVS